jgi:hypothetical protein
MRVYHSLRVTRSTSEARASLDFLLISSPPLVDLSHSGAPVPRRSHIPADVWLPEVGTGGDWAGPCA